MFEDSSYVEAGGLMSYGPDYEEVFRTAAVFVSKILKGAKPADLPVEQPTKFQLVINLMTGTSLGRSQLADAAVTSISISNSGRARAATTSVVTAGGIGDAQRLRRSSPSVGKSAARVR